MSLWDSEKQSHPLRPRSVEACDQAEWSHLPQLEVAPLLSHSSQNLPCAAPAASADFLLGGTATRLVPHPRHFRRALEARPRFAAHLPGGAFPLVFGLQLHVRHEQIWQYREDSLSRSADAPDQITAIVADAGHRWANYLDLFGGQPSSQPSIVRHAREQRSPCLQEHPPVQPA
jgi:hypothetical protein